MDGLAIGVAKMTVSGAIASTGGIAYVAEGWELLQVCSIPTRFCKLWIGFVPISTLTTWAGGKLTCGEGDTKFAVSLGRRFRHHFVVPAESDQCASRP